MCATDQEPDQDTAPRPPGGVIGGLLGQRLGLVGMRLRYLLVEELVLVGQTEPDNG